MFIGSRDECSGTTRWDDAHEIYDDNHVVCDRRKPKKVRSMARHKAQRYSCGYPQNTVNRTIAMPEHMATRFRLMYQWLHHCGNDAVVVLILAFGVLLFGPINACNLSRLRGST